MGEIFIYLINEETEAQRVEIETGGKGAGHNLSKNDIAQGHDIN